MNNEMIFGPVVGMVSLTCIVWIYMYARRIPAMMKLGRPVQTYATPDKIELLPDDVNYAAYNFKNLFELPGVFYVLCVYLYATGGVDVLHLTSAWAFLALRVLHSAIHCTVNIVLARFYVYFAGALVLWFMLARVVLNAGWF